MAVAFDDRGPLSGGGGASSFSQLIGEASVAQLANDGKYFQAAQDTPATVTAARCIVIMVSGSGAVGTQPIPSAAACGVGARLIVAGNDNGVGGTYGNASIDLDPDGGTINGGATLELTVGRSGNFSLSHIFVSDGSDWVYVQRGDPNDLITYLSTIFVAI